MVLNLCARCEIAFTSGAVFCKTCFDVMKADIAKAERNRNMKAVRKIAEHWTGSHWVIDDVDEFMSDIKQQLEGEG